MTALERLKELLKTATPEARELVEAFYEADGEWFFSSMETGTPPIEIMLSTPQAAAPASDLVRYGIEWDGPTNPIAKPMADGYWTPWHIANERITKIEGEK